MENDRLMVASCTKCHNESGRFARGYLTRQNSITIEHMVGEGNMPPLGFKITQSDREAIQRFMDGF
ncbi:hypothetical protein D3C83_187150 [compost metagenome]